MRRLLVGISIITPCYNEELNIQNCNDAVKAVFKKDLPGYRLEHIFSDNASEDGTVAIIRRLAAGDPNVKVILHSHNFGPFRSMFNALQ